MSGQRAFAFDAFQHCAFLAADIGASAAPQIYRFPTIEVFFRQDSDTICQNLCGFRIFVPQENINRLGLDYFCGDKHSFQKLKGIAVHKIPVLERTGFTLVRIYGHITRPRNGQNGIELHGMRETSAPKTSMAAIT